MREGGVDLLRRWIMWAAVRWTQFGLFRISQGGVGELFGVLAITALALPVLLPGATVVAVSLVAFWVLRLAVYVIARLVGRRSSEPVPRFLTAR